jgi:hypothetical protein
MKPKPFSSLNHFTLPSTNTAINFSEFKKPLLAYCSNERNADYRLFKVKLMVKKSLYFRHQTPQVVPFRKVPTISAVEPIISARLTVTRQIE